MKYLILSCHFDFSQMFLLLFRPQFFRVQRLLLTRWRVATIPSQEQLLVFWSCRLYSVIQCRIFASMSPRRRFRFKTFWSKTKSHTSWRDQIDIVKSTIEHLVYNSVPMSLHPISIPSTRLKSGKLKDSFWTLLATAKTINGALGLSKKILIFDDNRLRI